MSAAAISGAAFNVGGVLSILYLVKKRAENRGRFSGYLALLPTTRRIDVLAYRFLAFAFPLWTFTVAAGAIWAEYAWGRYWGWDPKETWALVTWVIYACYLHARSTAGWRGTPGGDHRADRPRRRSGSTSSASTCWSPACTPTPGSVVVGVPWWRSAVMYQVYPRSFADGNGDGEGDLAGLRARLPYLADLGVDGLWISPWFPSPMADGGYDVSDFTGIHPMFGTLEDADAVLREARPLGLRVIVDLVPNHTSDQHPWFLAALAAGPGSPERARYFFRDGRGETASEPPNNWISAFGGPAWTRVTEPDGRRGSGTCTCSPPSSPTSTGATGRAS